MASSSLSLLVFLLTVYHGHSRAIGEGGGGVLDPSHTTEISLVFLLFIVPCHSYSYSYICTNLLCSVATKTYKNNKNKESKYHLNLSRQLFVVFTNQVSFLCLLGPWNLFLSLSQKTQVLYEKKIVYYFFRGHKQSNCACQIHVFQKYLLITSNCKQLNIWMITSHYGYPLYQPNH